MFSIFVLFCSLYAAYGMIALSPGFEVVDKKWPEYVNQPQEEVTRKLSQKYPRVSFRVFGTDEPERGLEEFFFGKIKLVIDENKVVVEPPQYAGQEPDFSFATKILKKEWKYAEKIIKENLPDAKIIIEQKGKIIGDEHDTRGDYVLVKVDSDGIVKVLPEYVGGLTENKNYA